VTFGLLHFYETLTSTSNYDNPFAIAGYVVTIAASLLFGDFWWKLVEAPVKVTYLRGGIVGLLAGVTACTVLAIAVMPLSILGIIGVFLILVTAISTIPTAVFVGMIGIAVRKRV